MINTVSKEQYKILLEQKSTGYIFPNDVKSMEYPSSSKNKAESESEWEVVASGNSSEGNEKVFEDTETETATSNAEDLSKLFPAAKARLLSLRDLGAKKIGTLKMKLAESRMKTKEKEKNEHDASSRYQISNTSLAPELLTTPSGPYFTVQNVQNKNMMGAIHSYSSTLSVSALSTRKLHKLTHKFILDS
jgi:hypothetical protein